MKTGRAIQLAGITAAAVTPNRPGTLDADYSPLMDLLDFLTNAKVDGICLLGSTGEFVNFSFADRQRLVYLAVKRSRVPLMIGVSHSTLRGALQLAEEAIAAGADGLLLMPPCFFSYQQSEIEHFFREFARETGNAVPIVLYNIPQFNTGLGIETVRNLLDTGLFAGMKDSSGDWSYFEQLLALRRDRPFALLAGHDRIALQALRAGADGIVSGCACAIPEILVGLWKAHATGDQARADHWNRKLCEFVDRIGQFPTPIAIKRAVAIRGQKAGEPAIPLAPENSVALDAFAAWFQKSLKEGWPQ